jgi:nucleoid-associated protein YgaU
MSRALVILASTALFLTACEKKADPNARTEDASTGDAYTSLDTMNNNDSTIQPYTPPATTGGGTSTYTPPAPAPAPTYTSTDSSYTAAPAYTSTDSASTSSDELLAPASGGGGTYVVKRGDTLSKISRSQYGTDKRWRDIYKANKARISDPNKIRPGTKLIIP